MFIYFSLCQHWYCILSLTHRYAMNGSKVLILVFHKCAERNKNWYPIKVLYRNIDLLTTNTAYPNTIQHTPIPIFRKKSSNYQTVLRIPYMNSRKVQKKSIMEIQRSLSMLTSSVFSLMVMELGNHLKCPGFIPRFDYQTITLY